MTIEATMKRVAKPEGRHNIVIEEVEIGARYTNEAAVNPGIMGYSQAGIVTATGLDVEGCQEGVRVASVRPHAQYVVVM